MLSMKFPAAVISSGDILSKRERGDFRKPENKALADFAMPGPCVVMMSFAVDMPRKTCGKAANAAGISAAAMF